MRDECPMRRGRAIGGRIEIVAERRAKRRLIAFLDANFVRHRRPEAAAAGGQKLRERRGFGFELLRLAFGIGQRRARARFGFAGFRMRGLGGGCLRLAALQGFEGLLMRGGQSRAIVDALQFGAQAAEFRTYLI